MSMTGLETRLAMLRSWRAWTSSALRASSAVSLRPSLARTFETRFSNVVSVAPSTPIDSVITTSSSIRVRPRSSASLMATS